MKYLLFTILTALLLTSCMSTRVYTRDVSRFYENDVLVAERNTVTRDGDVISSTNSRYHVSDMGELKVVAATTTTEGVDYETTKVQLFKGSGLFAEREFSTKDGADAAYVAKITAEAEKAGITDDMLAAAVAETLPELVASDNNLSAVVGTTTTVATALEGENAVIPIIAITTESIAATGGEANGKAARVAAGLPAATKSTGTASSKSGSNSSSSTPTEAQKASAVDAKNVLLVRAYQAMRAEEAEEVPLEQSRNSIKMVTNFENIKVESTPNQSYIFYSVVGKPIVITACSAWALLKCAGYALINFGGGYNAVTGGKVKWMMPNVKKSREKAAAARAANGISAYPEYHLPFTNNHITVQSLNSETANVFSTSKKEVKVLAEQTLEYDNTISVERSAAADANSTSATIGMVGTVVTVPVSAISWVGGAAVGVYASFNKH